jgi:hypothetical protein
MKHKLRQIGGTEESHYLVSTKGPTEIDVIPNEYVYARVAVAEKLIYGAKLKITPELGFFIGKKKLNRVD